VKKKRFHSCNVLDSSPLERQLWHFQSERGGAKLLRDEKSANGAPLPEPLVRKDWSELYQPKFNIAWLPADRVFLRVVQLPAADPQEMLSMLEFQLEKLSPLPAAQVVWSAEIMPSQAEKMQTAIVCIVAREEIDKFVGGTEARQYLPDRLEIPQVNQILSDGVRPDGCWIYPGSGADAEVLTTAWWAGGTLQQLQLLRLPQAPAAAPGSPAADPAAFRAEYLREQLMQIAWAGELEGWLQLPVQWHLAASPESAAYWQPLLARWAGPGLESHPALDRAGLAHLSAARAARGEIAPSLLPPEFSVRYRQQYIDRLWMRGLGALVALYLLGVLAYMGALQYHSFRDAQLRDQVAGIAYSYTNVLRLKERVEVMQEQLNLKYAALDCWKIASEQLPADFTLINLVFGRGRVLQLYGSAPVGQEPKVLEYNEALRKAEVNGQPLFKDVTPPNLMSRPGSAGLNWNFDAQLNLSTPEP